MTPAISQACTLPNPFEADVQGYAEGGCNAIEVWLTKLETHLESHTVESTQSLLGKHNTSLVAASYQGGLLLTQGEARQASRDHFLKRLELCQTFRIPTLVLVADFTQTVDQQAIALAIHSLKELGQWAEGFGVSIALEFRGRGTFCSCLDTAITLVEECSEANVGVCFDAFHYYQGPSKPEDLQRLTKQNLIHVQLCDVAGIPREWMTDGDRVFPGDGDFQLAPIIARLNQIGYERAVSLELMNPVLWKSKPSQIAELGMTALHRVLR
jgi:4-hydroxyphenylpyruvate dioxygenase